MPIPTSERRAAPAVIRLSPPDNIAVALRPLKPGETVMLDGVPLTIADAIPIGHKLAARALRSGEIVVKYGCPIGTATSDIAAGQYVHTHNLESNYLSTALVPDDNSPDDAPGETVPDDAGPDAGDGGRSQ